MGETIMKDDRSYSGEPLVGYFSAECCELSASGGGNEGEAGVARSLLDSSTHGIFAIDCAFHVVMANSRAREMLGIEGAVLPVPCAQVIGKGAAKRIARLFSGSPETRSACITCDAGLEGESVLQMQATRLVDPVGRTLGVGIVLTGEGEEGVTSKICHPERVKALGLYSAGIIHEFNNLLSVIAGRASLGLVADGPEAKNLALENVITAARRAEHITRNLLSYVQRREPEFVLTDLRKPILEALALLEIELAAAHVEVRREIGEIPLVTCDPLQVSQVIFNLVRNAKEAMPEGGVVTVGLRRESRHAVISVSDTGTGMDAEAQSHIFEPFVSHGKSRTVKPSGTGLGLFIAKEVVMSHGGEITSESAVARGSKFKVRLPFYPGGDRARAAVMGTETGTELSASSGKVQG